jgi:hypothetical protein
MHVPLTIVHGKADDGASGMRRLTALIHYFPLHKRCDQRRTHQKILLQQPPLLLLLNVTLLLFGCIQDDHLVPPSFVCWLIHRDVGAGDTKDFICSTNGAKLLTKE